MRNIFTRLWVVSLLLLVTATVSAQLSSLEVGQVYRFKSARADRSLSADGVDDVHTKTTDAADTKQEWYVTKDGYYVLRNLACGKYLKGAQSSNTAWSMTDDYSHEYNKFELYTSNTTLNTLKTKGSDSYGYMHDDNNGDNGGYNIVGWLNGNGNTGTHWTITKVNYTTDEITALLEKAPTTAELEGYTTALGELFSDAACVTPKLASLSAAKSNAAYSNLPTALQAMVDKVYNEKAGTIEAWAEDNADDAKGDWSGEYAKKFRVQMYEPYSIAGDITSWLGINAHANNDNPTGIHVPEAGTLYVMVEGTIKDGASLRIVDGGHNWRVTNATSGGYTLNPGLNVINYTGTAGQLYICYNVDTYNPDGATTAEKFPHKLSEYPPLKIHIEGGAITGYYNACGDFRAADSGTEDLWKTITGASVDNDADWEYMETRANLNVIPLLAHRQILLFHLNDYTHEDGGTSKGMASYLPDLLDVPATPYNSTKKWADYGMECDPSTGKINIMLEAWDRIMYSELATMGLVSQSTMVQMNAFYPRWESDYTTKYEIYDYTEKSPIDNKTYQEFCNGLDYSEYFNHHGIALGTESGYMYGGWDHCGYSITTYDGIVRNMANNAGSTWGPAHEIGHQHQPPLTLNGLTEVTNNLFSNIALWYKGMSTSRYNGDNGSLESVLNAYNTKGSDIYTNNIWALTHLYYRLWLYYHLAGNNTQFWPRLYELLRQQPMQKGYNVSGDVSTLHFYKLACQAAGEDLTEFFRAHGYFSIMDDRLVGDYSNSVYEVSQEMIDEAIAEVKEMGYKENLAIIFICDDDENATYVQHDGVSKREIYGETTPNSDFGSVSDFINGNVSVETAYTATLNSDGTLTMSGGEGGVGFLLLNEDGEIVSFSNKSTFALSDEAKESIMTGNVTVVSIGSDINAEPVATKIDLTAMQKNILGELIAKAQQIIDKIDDTYTRIGFYKGAAVADLATILANAKTVYDAGTSGYEAAYDLLYAEYQKVLENPDAKIPFDPSLTYIITNKAYTNETMWVNDGLTVRSEGGVDQTADAAKWQFKATASDGVYNIYNKKGYYCPAVAQSTSMTATTAANADALYTLQEMETGVWAIKLSPAADYRNFHSSWSNVVGWETGSNATRWYLTAVEPNATIADLTELEVYITKTEALLGEVLGTVTYTSGENIELQTTTEGSAGYIWSNAPCATEGNITNLVDGATNNYFHTEWNGDAVTSGDHYIAVDLGAGNTLSRFAFSHTTRSGVQNDFPKSVDVYGSDEKNGTYKYLGSATGMPQSAGTFWQFDGMIISSHRYLRFNMHANRGYWHMAEFDIMPVTSYKATVNDTYSSTVTVETVQSAMEALYNGKGVTLSMSPTEADIDAKLEVLITAYETLYSQYEATITARKNTLAQLAANTQNLINQVGTVSFAQETPVELNDGNFYCNAPYIASDNSDNSAEYVSKLTDGNNSTYLHTRWNANSDDGDYHYLRVDMGEGVSIGKFNFTYTTASRGKKDMPLTMVVEGANEIDGDNTTADTFKEIVTLTSLPEVLNTNTVYNSVVLGSNETPYRYLRFKVTDITVEESDGNGHPFFTMAEFALTSIVDEKTTVNSKYKSVVTEELLLASVHSTNSSNAMSTNALVTSVPMLDAQIADQQAAYDKLNEAMQKVTCDKTELQAAYDKALALYNKMADAEGNVTSDYAPSTLNVEQLAAAKTALDAAKDKLDNSTVQDEIDTAKGNLETAFEPLNTVESLNVAATKDKSTLNALIASTNTLLGTINGNIENNSNYYASSSLALDELNTALRNAQDAVSRYYLTETQYTAAYEALNNCYTAANNVVTADVAKDELNELITTMRALLAETTVSGAQTAGSLPLQVTDKTESFYIFTYPRATDDNGKGAIIDETDGVSNTGTFIGTYWQSSSEAYSHYVEIDLGVNTVIEDFSIDYTTRYSGAADSRPIGLKFYGSNDKETYTELFSVTEGLPTTENTKWEMSAPYELEKNYRYIRVAVASNRGGCFNMSDFNLYSHCTAMVNQNYSTSDIFDYLPAALREYCDAKEAVGKYLVADDCTAAKEQLQAQIDAIQSVIDSNININERGGLETLANETNALVTKVVTINEAETAITMQCTDENAPYYLYCNAAGTRNGGADALGVAALVGEKAANTEHLHTAYQGNTDDDLDHYLRLDMGEDKAMMSFKFSYTGRNDGNNSDPKVMLIEGSNDLENFEPIAKLTDLPSSSTPTTYTSSVLGNGKAYRYIRFMVIKTNNNAMYKEHPFFVLSQFAVTAYKTIDVNSEYASKLPMTTLVTANNEVAEAGVIVNQFYVTQDAYDSAYAELEAAYDALKVATAADKTELNNLIEATRILKNGLYETVITDYTANEITLSVTEGDAGYLYCNAPERNSIWSTDNAGVAAAIDLTAEGEPNLDTFLHTEYGNDQSADGLDHYLRVDLGAGGATDYIEFGYYGRSGHEPKSPKKVIVAATNDLTDGGVWTEIATLNPARASASTETKTGCLGNGVEYRYWRFLVEETHGGGKDGNNHQFFCMTEFNVYKCTEIVKDEQLKYSPTIYIYTTTELVTEVENAIAAATAVKDNADATQETVDAEVETLQAIYNKLAEALENAGLPVEITTDEANPVLYKIISKRADDASKVLQFDEPASDKVAIVTTAGNASYQAWYFMKGENGYLIKPFNGDGKMLGVSSTGDAAASASIAEAPTYKEWDFSRSTVTGCTDYFYIYVNGTSHACLSHNGGFNKTDKLGIWAGGWNTNDGGSLFKFVEAEFENDNARYYQLSDFENTLEYQTSVTPEGTTVGAFVNGGAYSTAYTTASTLIEAGNTSDAAACKDAYTALRAADAGLEQNLPEEGKIYRIDITPGLTDSRAGASMRIDDNGKLACGVFDAANARFYFTFEYDDEGKLYMKNLHSATYLDEALNSRDNNNVQVGADAEDIANAKKITLNTLGTSGDVVVVGIVPDGGDMLNCAGKPGNVVAFDNTAVDKASAWVISEVEIEEVEENVAHSVTLGNNTTGGDQTTRYSSLCLGYPVTLPDGVTAYIVTAEPENNVVRLTSIGNSIPANTPVILSGTLSSCSLSFTSGAVAAVDSETNLLGGSNYTTYVSCLDENGNNIYNIYMLTRKNGLMAMRWVYENFDENKNNTGSNDEGGYVKCAANKAYLKLGGATVQSLSTEYFFGFWGATTEIDGVEGEENPLDGTIYDLQGRKIDEVKAPGFYIVNGKKMYVDSEMLK